MIFICEYIVLICLGVHDRQPSCLNRPDYYPDQSKSKGIHRVDGDYVSRLLFEEKVQESLSKDETIKVKKKNILKC